MTTAPVLITYTIAPRTLPPTKPDWTVTRTVHAPGGDIVFHLSYDDTWHDNFHAAMHYTNPSEAADALASALLLYEDTDGPPGLTQD